MAFFPPTGPANNTAHLNDLKWEEDTGEAPRFAAFEMPVTVYWPWLSWDQEDVAIGDHQQAILRCCLIGEPDDKLYGLVPDGIGSIIRIGDEANEQLWEVIHFFNWYLPGDAEKKLCIVWARLFTPAPEPTPIEGGSSAGEAVQLNIGVEYLVDIAAGSPQWFTFEGPGSGVTQQWDGTVLTGGINYSYYEGQEPPAMPDATGSFPDFGTSFEPPQPVYFTMTAPSGASNTGTILITDT